MTSRILENILVFIVCGLVTWVCMSFIVGCAEAEPLEAAPLPEACAECFETCDGLPSDRAARSCVQDCLVDCEHADGGQ